MDEGLEPFNPSIPISSLPNNTPGSPGFYHGKLFANSNLEQPSGLSFIQWFVCDYFLLNCSDLGQHRASFSLHGLVPSLADSLGAPGHRGQPQCQGGYYTIDTNDLPSGYYRVTELTGNIIGAL